MYGGAVSSVQGAASPGRGAKAWPPASRAPTLTAAEHAALFLANNSATGTGAVTGASAGAAGDGMMRTKPASKMDDPGATKPAIKGRLVRKHAPQHSWPEGSNESSNPAPAAAPAVPVAPSAAPTAPASAYASTPAASTRVAFAAVEEEVTGAGAAQHQRETPASEMMTAPRPKAKRTGPLTPGSRRVSAAQRIAQLQEELGEQDEE